MGSTVISRVTISNGLPSTKPYSSPPAPFPFQNLQVEIFYDVVNRVLVDNSLSSIFASLKVVIRKYGLPYSFLMCHPQYPFLTPFTVDNFDQFCKELFVLFWHLSFVYKITMLFPSDNLCNNMYRYGNGQLNLHQRYLGKFPSLFHTPKTWYELLCWHQDEDNGTVEYVHIMFHRPPRHGSFISRKPADPQCYHHIVDRKPSSTSCGYTNYDLFAELQQHESEWKEFLSRMCFENAVDPASIPGCLMNGTMNAWGSSSIAKSSSAGSIRREVR